MFFMSEDVIGIGLFCTDGEPNDEDVLVFLVGLLTVLN